MPDTETDFNYISREDMAYFMAAYCRHVSADDEERTRATNALLRRLKKRLQPIQKDYLQAWMTAASLALTGNGHWDDTRRAEDELLGAFMPRRLCRD